MTLVWNVDVSTTCRLNKGPDVILITIICLRFCLFWFTLQSFSKIFVAFGKYWLKPKQNNQKRQRIIINNMTSGPLSLKWAWEMVHLIKSADFLFHFGNHFVFIKKCDGRCYVNVTQLFAAIHPTNWTCECKILGINSPKLKDF